MFFFGGGGGERDIEHRRLFLHRMYWNIMYFISGPGARGTVSWGIALEAVRFRVRFPMEFFIDITLLTVALGSTQPLTENE